jgi:hypothetical protein
MDLSGENKYTYSEIVDDSFVSKEAKKRAVS